MVAFKEIQLAAHCNAALATDAVLLVLVSTFEDPSLPPET